MIPEAARAKLAKIIPRLASENEAEILVCVKAIRKILASRDCDLHDLATALTNGAATTSSTITTDFQPSTIAERILEGDMALDDWTIGFLENIHTLLLKGWKLSEKQQAKLDEIVENFKRETGWSPK